MIDKRLLNRAYCDISWGYTCCSYKGQQVYLRHFSLYDQLDLDNYYEEQLKYAEKNRVPSEKDKLEFLKKEELWTNEDEKKLRDGKDYLNGLRKSVKSYFIASERKQVEELIKKKEEEVAALLTTKLELVGLTREKQASKTLNSYYVYKSFYKDKEMSELFFSDEDFDDLDDFDLAELIGLYNLSTSHLTTLCIKHLAIAPFFQNYFYLCGDDLSTFYGKPISQLTYYQTELLNYGNYYKQLFQEFTNMPKDVREDPEKISAYIDSAKSAKDLLAKGGDSKNVGIVGATKADLEALNIPITKDPAQEKFEKEGKKTLSMKELIALQDG